MMNTILNLIGWLPLWALMLCGVWAYIELGIKFVRGIIDEYLN